MHHEIPGGTVVSRRWLLGAAMASTAQLCLASAVGAIVYEVASDDPSGATPSNASVGTARPPANGALKRFGPVGQNLAIDDVTFYGFGFPVLDRSKLSTPWSLKDGPAVNAIAAAHPNGTGDYSLAANGFANRDGYPTSMGGSSRIESIYNVEGKLGPAGVRQQYVIECTLTDCNLGVDGAVSNVSNEIVAGKRRITFDAPNGGTGLPQGVYVTLYSLPTPFGPNDHVVMFRADEEAEFRAGRLYRQQFIDRVKGYGVFRFMDWSAVNTYTGEQRDFSEYRTRNAASWNNQVPLEHQVAVCNEANVAGWFNLPHKASDDFVRQFVGYIEANLAPHLPYTLEVSNEVWLPDGGRKQYAHFCNPTWPRLSADPAWGAYGYRSAQIMAIAHQASGYAKRCRPFFGSQGENTAVTEGVLAGIRAAIAEWSDPASTPRARDGITAPSLGYVSEFAARFKTPGQIFAGFGGAIYLGAGMGRDRWGTDDPQGRAKFQQWAAATDDSGLAGFFNQLRTGQEMTDPNHYNLANWVGVYAGQHAISVREQIEMWAYEGCITVEDFHGQLDAGMIAFRTRALHDPRMIQLTRDWITQCMAAGYTVLVNLCDISGPGGAYGSAESAYRPQDYPRHVGLLAVQASPPPPPPLSVTATTSGATKVGKKPTTRIQVTGGSGGTVVAANGLVAGRVFDNFRDIDGAFIQQTGQPVPATITVTDAAGASATVMVMQDVGPAPVYPTGRYLRYEMDNGGGPIDIEFVGVLDPDGQSHGAAWQGDNDRAPYLGAEDGMTYYSGFGQASPQRASGDLGGPVTASSIVITRSVNLGSVPLHTRVWLSAQPFAPGGGGGTLILDVTEANGGQWNANARRVFDVST
jgi:hypothetical protein